MSKPTGSKTGGKKIVILYHGACSDGFGGAWAAWKKFGNKAAYVPLYRGMPPPKDLKNKEIYMIDFMYSSAETAKLIAENVRVTGIDHHITARKSVALTEKPLFALNHSGSVLAWKYFHPGKKIPLLLRYVEDTDLWKLKLPRSREIFAFRTTLKFDFKIWDKVARGMESPVARKKYAEEGMFLEIYRKKLLDELAGGAEAVSFEGYKILAVNAPHEFSSELGEMLIKKKPPLGIIWSQTGGSVGVSLRSNGRVDVAKLAVKYGGGGHKGAAGFRLRDTKKFPWKSLKK